MSDPSTVHLIGWAYAFGFAVVAVYFIILGVVSIAEVLREGDEDPIVDVPEDPPDDDGPHLSLVQ